MVQKKMLLFLLLIACKINAQEPPKIRINSAQAFGGSASEYFNEIEYIPLETTKESMFGYISNLIVTDSSFVVYDLDTQSSLFFDLQGKFITKIKGKGENFRVAINYNKQLNLIELVESNKSTHKRETKYYNKLGGLTNRTKEIQKASIIDGTLPLGDNFYALGQGCTVSDITKVKDKIIHRIEIYKNDSLYKSFLPINQQENTAICAINGFLYFTEESVKVENNAFYISTPLDYLVYHVDKDTAKAVFQFVFPANRVFANEILKSNDKKLIKNFAERFLMKPDPLKIMNVSNIFYRGDNLFFKIDPRIYLSSGGSEIQYQYNFIFNTKTGKLVSLERLVGDQTNGYLPIFNERISVHGLKNLAGDYYYSNISSFKMFAAYEANKVKKPVYSATLQNYFKTQSRKSNPVIVRMKLKE